MAPLSTCSSPTVDYGADAGASISIAIPVPPWFAARPAAAMTSVAEGLMIRFGRYISIPDIEAQLAPNNYMYSHSMTYTFDNFTNTGVQATVAVNTEEANPAPDRPAAKLWIWVAEPQFVLSIVAQRAIQKVKPELWFVDDLEQVLRRQGRASRGEQPGRSRPPAPRASWAACTR